MKKPLQKLFRFMDWSIRTKMAALFIVVSLLPLAIAALIDIQEAEDRLLANTAALLAARSDQLVNQLDEFHSGYKIAVNRLAHFPLVIEFSQSQSRIKENDRLTASVRSMLNVWPASDTSIRGVGILDLSGTVKIATERKLIGMNLSYHRYVQKALRGVVVISDIHLAESQVGETPTIAYLAPVFAPGGKLVGIAALWIRANSLWEIAKASNELAGLKSFAVLFNQQGIRIAHTYSNEIIFHPGGKLTAELIDSLAAERHFGEKTRELLEDVRAFPEQFERALSESPDQGLFRGFAPVNQAWNYGVARRFKTVHWTLFYMIPEKSLNAQITELTRQKWLFAIAIILIALIAGSLFAFVILKPIVSLSKATELIAAGDLTARIRTKHTDELGRLGESFNTMAERIEIQSATLQKTNDDLELRVQERTAAIAQTTKNLEIEIAERKRAAEALQESQQLFSNAFHIGPVGMTITRIADGKFIDVNDSFLTMFEFRREEAIGHTSTELNLWTQEERKKLIQRQLASGGLHNAELQAQSKSGRKINILFSSQPMVLRGETHHITTMIDITERKLAEDSLRDSSKEILNLRTALDEHAIVAITDAQGKITFVNDKFCAISKYSREELIGQDHRIINSAYHPKEFIRELWRTIAQGKVWKGEIRNRAKDGSIYWVDTTIVPFLKDDGKPYQYVAIRADITERVQSKENIKNLNATLEQRVRKRTEQLESANKELESFSYSISHDLRAPLRAINGFIQILAEDYGGSFDAEGSRVCTVISSEAQRMGELIDDLLSFSRLSRTEMIFSPINMSDLAASVVIELRAAAQKEQVDFRIEALPFATGDPKLIRQVWVNLLSNAVKFSSKREKIIVTVGNKESGSENIYYVRDNGAGFNMDYVSKLFGVFQRLHSESEFEGTGVGLAIVQRVIHRHGGRVWAEGEIGKGATFYFALPKKEISI